MKKSEKKKKKKRLTKRVRTIGMEPERSLAAAEAKEGRVRRNTNMGGTTVLGFS